MAMCYICGGTQPGKGGWHRINVDGNMRNAHEKCQIVYNKARRTAQQVTNQQGELLLKPDNVHTAMHKTFED